MSGDNAGGEICIKTTNGRNELKNRTYERFIILYEAAQSWITKHNLAGLVHPSQDVMWEAVYSYFFDITRVKCFHTGIHHADSHKKAAFTMKWLMKFRPLQIAVPLPDIDDAYKKKTVYRANELFAIEFALNFLRINQDQVPQNYIGNLVYTLRFRDIDPLVLSSQMYLLEQLYQTSD
jgi:hypothetical protein